MRWLHYVSYFFGGVVLANSLPHLSNGISGHAFHTPFGLSTSVGNVLWGFFNLALSYLFVCRVDDFNLRKNPHVLALGAGILVMSVYLANIFGGPQGGL